MGYGILEKMGWRYGGQLGKTGLTGLEQPIKATRAMDDEPLRSGLGFKKNKACRHENEQITFVTEGHFELLHVMQE